MLLPRSNGQGLQIIPVSGSTALQYIYIERKSVLKPSYFEKNREFLEFNAEYMIFFWYANSQLSSQKP